MLTKTRTSTRKATTKDLQKLANLIHFETHIHRHLDYRPPLDWVGEQPFLVMEQHGAISAALACPPDPPQVAWIRLFAVGDKVRADYAWETLQAEAMSSLQAAQQPCWLAAIPMQRWFEDLLIKSAFEYAHSITMLNWESQPLPAAATNTGCNLRPMTLDDMLEVQRVDQASFTPIWQNSLMSLELAFRQASIATVVESDGRLVGYQISSATPIGGHLARLAVVPELRGRGIGRQILHDLLRQFSRRGAQTITVNTQKDNLASLALYRRTGFEFTGEEYPVYKLDIPTGLE
jgi:[ribosomal protein S18]-alanine N-acetyltransferase